MTIEELIRKAQSGDAEAQYELACRYCDGEDVENDGDKAFYWAQLSASQNYTKGINLLGICYDYGIGVEKDEKQAVELYKKAAEQGYAAAQCNLGVCYECGTGVEKDEKQAVEWYKKAAEQNDVDAQWHLGACYYCGIGIEKDKKQAFQWYKKAAAQGNATAQSCLGICYENGTGVEKDEKQAVEWYKKAEAQGNSTAQYCLGVCCENGIGLKKDEKQAVEWYKKAAKQENNLAQYRLGFCYGNGIGVEQNEKKAFEWCKKAAEHGNSQAQCYLSQCYFDGIGVEIDNETAFQWLLKAAQSGDGFYCYLVGDCYSEGKGVNANDELAFQWYMKAANTGNSLAGKKVAEYYEQGKNVTKSYENALNWYLCSAELEENENNQIFPNLLHYKIASYYAKGIGTDKSREKAIYWFTKYNDLNPENKTELLRNFHIFILVNDFVDGTHGATKDYAEAVFWLNYVIDNYGFKFAYYLLGRIYEEGGNGVERDLNLAIKYYILSAEEDHFEGQMALASCYERGVGVEYDLEKALIWYQKAAEKNNDEAKIALEEFTKRHINEFESKYGFANIGKRYDLFISWNHNDKAFKDNLVSGIEGFNFDDTHMKDERVYPHYRAWESDRDAEGVIEESIRNAVNNSKFFLVILSENSINSYWVEMEIRMALDRLDNGSWSPKNLLIIYLNSPTCDVGKIIAERSADDVFRKLAKFAAHYSTNNVDDLTVKNICERIRRGLEEDVIHSYRYKMTKGQNSFKYSLRSQYSDNGPNNVGGIADALLSFEDGYIQRNVYSMPYNEAVSQDALADGGDFFLVGEGGTGKSLYISNLMRKHFTDSKFFLRINIIDYDEYIQTCNHLTELLSHELNRYLVDSDEYRSTRIIERARGDAGNPITIIIDGLDEVNAEKRVKLVGMIREYKKSNIADRFIFTSRTATCFDDLQLIFDGKLALYRLYGFEDADREKLYDNIKSNLIKTKESPTALQQAHARREKSDEELKADFFLNLDSIGDEIKKNPLLLSNLIFIYLKNRGKDFPSRKYEIVGHSVGIFVDELENDRGTLSRFPYRKYLVGRKLEDMLGNIAFRKLQGCTHDFRRLLIEYFEDGRCMDGDDPETVGNEVFNYLSRRAIISSDKITHDIFTAFFACCYLYNNIYENKKLYDVYRVVFRKGINGDPEYNGEEYFKLRLNPDGEFRRDDSMWPEVSSELIMKLDYEIHALSAKPMDKNNPSFPVYDTTLKMAVKENGFSDAAIKILNEFAEKEGSFYFTDFIRAYLKS